MDRFTMDDIVAPAVVLMAGEVKEEVKLTLELLQSRKQYIYLGCVNGKIDKANERMGAVAPSYTNSPEPPPMPPNNDWPKDAMWLSPEEEKILRVLPFDRWMTAKEISEKTGIPFDKCFSGILQNLCRRNFIESRNGQGYRRRNGNQSQGLDS